MMASTGLTVFWIVVAAIFAPAILVSYVISIFKACVDRKRIQARNAERRAAKLEVMMRAPSDNVSGSGVSSSRKKPNIVLVEDEERVRKYRGTQSQRVSTSTLVDSNITNNSTSTVSREEKKVRKKDGGHNVVVTVEHNLKLPNGVEMHQHTHRHRGSSFGSERGVDNLGSSFSDVGAGSQPAMAIEMDNLSSECGEYHTVTTPSDGSSWQANTDVDTVSDSELADNLHSDASPQKVVNSATRLLPSADGQSHDGHRQHPSRPQKPKRGHKHNENTCHNGSLTNLTSSGENIACLNGMRVLVTSQSQDHDLDQRYHYSNSIRRNSYAAAIDIDCDFADTSPTRSLSDDDLRRQSYPMHTYQNESPYSIRGPSGDNGRINKGFSKSAEERIIEM